MIRRVGCGAAGAPWPHHFFATKNKLNKREKRGREKRKKRKKKKKEKKKGSYVYLL